MTSKENVNKFLVYLQNELNKKNISVPKFAKMLGVPKSTVYSWLNRTSVMSLEKYYRVLKMLNIKKKLSIKLKSENVEYEVEIC